MGWGFRIKIFVYYGCLLKSLSFRIGSQKIQYIGGDCLKKSACIVSRFKRGLGKKRGGIFDGG